MLNLFLIPLLLATLISFLATPVVIRLSWYLGLIDDPKKNKHPKVIHNKATPRGGGLAIYIAVLIACILLLSPVDKHLLGILIGMSIVLIMGLLDDKYDLNPYLRFCIQFLAACAPVAAGIGISFLTNPWNGLIDLSQPQIQITLFGDIKSIWILSDLFAIVWLMALMNFLNMGAKGVPGQLSGIVGIASIVIALLSLRFSADITEWPVIILASITAGAYLGHLPFNISPQRIMPSFAGSNIAGFLLGVLSILSTAKTGTLLLVLAIPIIDTGYTIIRRVLAGKSPFWGDRGHLHHKLMDLGLSQTQVAVFYWATTAVLGILALNLNALNKFYTIVGAATALAGLLLWITYRKKL